MFKGICQGFGFNGYSLLYEWLPQFVFVILSLTIPVLRTFPRSFLFADSFKKKSEHLIQRTYKCRNPTRELKWLLGSPEGFELFKNFLREELSVENLLFWEAVNLFKQGNMDPQMIFENYILDSGPLTVNLSHRSRFRAKAIFVPQDDEYLAASRSKISHESQCEIVPDGVQMVSNLTSREVLLPSSNRSLVLSRGDLGLKDTTEAVLESCQDEILHLMAKDSFLRMCRTSKFYNHWVNNLQSYDEQFSSQ
eukprot:TRINITY_DN15211_c0_g2_i1.p2 TRINITY_DN15211_c0_g2~~TRINITY_DN15211_c0_g2_i1.p2  ORF type:complete len:251 (+),score=56.23 TRINITY_DN15211_c0_g2_i1:947-1699(+)